MNNLLALGLTVLCVLLISAGQILFKMAAAEGLRRGHLNLIEQWLTWSLFFALVIYAIATLLWVWVLRHVPLSVAYPIYALAFIIVPVCGYIVLNEQLSWHHFVGGLTIIVGVMIMSHGGQN
jgi:drug/metabolite transporter (DMT)-like permease